MIVPLYMSTAKVARMRIIPMIRILLVALLISQTISRTSLLSSSGVIFAATSTTPCWSPTFLTVPALLSQGCGHRGIAFLWYLPATRACSRRTGRFAGWGRFVVEKSTKPSRIMTAYLEALSYRMPDVAISFNIGYSCHDFVTQFWIICHDELIFCLIEIAYLY